MITYQKEFMENEEEAENFGPVAADQADGRDSEVAAHEPSNEETQPQDDSAQNRNWRAARESKRQQDQRILELERQIAAQKPADVDPWSERDKDALASVGDIDERTKRLLDKQAREFNDKFADLSMRARDPNYKKTIETYANTLTESQKQAAMMSGNPLETAYDMVVNSKAYYLDQMKNNSHSNTRQAERNLLKPGSSGNVGNQGAFGFLTEYKRMSPQERLALGDRYAQGG